MSSNQMPTFYCFAPFLETLKAATQNSLTHGESDETVSNALTLVNGLERRTQTFGEDDFEELQYFPNFYALLKSIDSGNHCTF